MAMPSPTQTRVNCHSSLTWDSRASMTAPSSAPPAKTCRPRPWSISRPATGANAAETTSARVKAAESSVFDQPSSRSQTGSSAGKE